jgi:hypothetical protein
MRYFISLALLVFAAPTFAAPAPQWKVTQAAGDVRVLQGDKVQPARAGRMLPAGAAISTGSNARAVIVRGQEFIVLSPGTQLRLPEIRQQTGLVQIIQEFGSALFKIEKKSTPHFGVKTRYLVAVVKGTTFRIDASGNRASVAVTDGAVQVSTNDHKSSMLLTPGQEAAVGSDTDNKIAVQGNPKKLEWPSAKIDTPFEWRKLPGQAVTFVSSEGQMLLIFLLITLTVGLTVANVRLRHR